MQTPYRVTLILQIPSPKLSQLADPKGTTSGNKSLNNYQQATCQNYKTYLIRLKKSPQERAVSLW